MSETIYKDYLPANARVIIDYTKKQKVGFSYPIEWTYWKAVWRRAFPTVVSFWISFPMYFFYIFSPYILILGTLGLLISTIFFPRTITQPEIITYFDFLHVGLPFIIIIFYLIGIPFLITLWLALNKERMSKYLPRMGFFAAKLLIGTKEKTFNVKDIVENRLIIPSFSNVYLEYKTSGDFNKYLEKIEIIEIPFNYKTRRLFLPFSSKKEKNDYNFRAVFYFSKKPKKGELKTEFI